MQTAASMVEARQRLAAERERTQMEAQASERAEQRMAMEATARRQTAQAYHDAQLALQQQRLQQAAQQHAAAAKQAAMKMADQHAFAQDLAGGMPIEQALYRHPTLSSPSAAIAAHKDTLDLASQRLENNKRQLDLREQEIKDREKRVGNIGTMDLPVKSGDLFSGTMRVPLNSPVINQTLGTNAPPGTGTNFNAMPVPAATEVKRKTKDGKTAIFDGTTKKFLRYADD